MEQLKTTPVSDAHLLCLMEQWFDRTQPVIKALADFNYIVHDDSRLECPFCRKQYAPKTASRILAGKTPFRHKTNCLVLEARHLRSDMLADVEAEWHEYKDSAREEEPDWQGVEEQNIRPARNVFQLFQL